MYERHCILIWAHNARVPAARHMRLTRLTGPTSIPVQTEMRATHFARVFSKLSHRAQLAIADTRICASHHSSIALHLDFASKHLEALRGKRRLQAGMQSNVGGKAHWRL